jgi:tRNA pseudouridine38-40 synthase
MQTAAREIIGSHDFTSFAAIDPDRTMRTAGEDEGPGPTGNIRTIVSSAWREENETLIYRVRGDGFLHHMVRNLVGTTVDIGRGHLEADAMPRILAARAREAAGPTAPARGLFLDSVEY